MELHCNFKSCETNVANEKAVNFRAFTVVISMKNILVPNLLQIIAIAVVKTMQMVLLNILTNVNK